MAWSITADPQRFDEAIEYFLARTVITGDEAARLDDDSRQRAFWVGGGLQLSQIQRVFDALNQAFEKGEPFKDFQKRMRSTLRDPAHAETVFRNAVQKAYSAGRYRQLREVEQWRPFWRTNAILDGRTSPTCKPLAVKPVILPASDPWWSRNWPPRHHRCRLQIESLRRSEAERIGVTTQLPEIEPSAGWGRLPDNDPVWKPDPRKHDAALLRELEQKQAREPKPRKPKSNPAHDPAHWAKEYDHLGEAGPAAAYGRAMAERAYDRPAGEVLAELIRIKQAGHPALEGIDVERVLVGKGKLDPRKPLRNSVLAQRQRGLIALSEHTRTIKPGEALSLEGDKTRGTQSAESFYNLTLARGVTRPKGWRYSMSSGVRATADNVQRRVNLDFTSPVSTIVHELAHAVEFSDSRALQRSVAFMLRRTRGESLQKLSRLKSGKYRDDEVARPDKFLDAYIGKDYATYTKTGDYYATEVTAMGYQWLADHGMLSQLGERDPEMLYFLLGQLAGK